MIFHQVGKIGLKEKKRELSFKRGRERGQNLSLSYERGRTTKNE